ncbi:MAG: VWA domain-containing protein, partial [Candidatus Binataceae bacterium]
MDASSSGLRALACAMIAAALLMLPAVAGAALQISIGNPGLEHFETDAGVRLDFGVNDSNGQTVGNLRKDDVKVFEDGKEAKILDFRGVGQGRPVDIVFVLDVTESMQPYIDAVKQNMVSFAQDLAAHNRDYRLALVTFEDYVVSKYDDCNCPYQKKMTSNVKEFVDWVETLRASGGGDIPENQLEALEYASTFPFRPDAEGIIILVTDAPAHHAGDGSQYTQHDQAYYDHKGRDKEVTDLTGDKVAAALSKNGITLYAVAPPPFIAPEYAQIVTTTRGKLYNIVTEEGRFASLVREIGKSIATEYSLTYRTPRPIEDGTKREVELQISHDGQNAVADTSYQVRGLGGAAINIPENGAGTDDGTSPMSYRQISFSIWNLAIPLIALLGLFGLSRMRFGVPAEELKAILEAKSQPTVPRSAAPAPRPRPAPVTASRGGAVASTGQGARLLAIDPVDPVPSEYALLKDEISIGRGEDNDVVIPH